MRHRNGMEIRKDWMHLLISFVKLSDMMHFPPPPPHLEATKSEKAIFSVNVQWHDNDKKSLHTKNEVSISYGSKVVVKVKC